MELTQLGFLEELLAPRRGETWNTMSTGLNELFPTSAWSFDSFDENPAFLASFNPPFSALPTPIIDHRFEYSYPLLDGFTGNVDSAPPLQAQEDEELGFLGFENQISEENNNNNNNNNNSCKIEDQAMEAPAFTMGLCCGEKKPKSKKLEGQPSKNLMAERRRRKRLNDRLSMLRSIVPKISKMDRTSILGDTIDYMKELLEKIGKLQEEMKEEEGGNNHMSLIGITKEVKADEVMVRNSPKFEVERRDQGTRINICCTTKPGLLLSTVNTLEALGLEIQQCVISSFNDFAMQASCSEVAEQRACISSEEIKEALFRNAGYGGRCL